VIAVRITSEHAEDGFKPTCGTIDELQFRSTPEVWGYFSVKSGGKIHEFSDSQFGHVFAKGVTRGAAIRSMVVALKELNIRGEIRTIVDYAIDMLQHADFVDNRIHTGWLDGRIAAQVRVERPPWHLCIIAGAVHFALDATNAGAAEVRLLLVGLPLGDHQRYCVIPACSVPCYNATMTVRCSGSLEIASMWSLQVLLSECKPPWDARTWYARTVYVFTLHLASIAAYAAQRVCCTKAEAFQI
jgi:hypothetical protein